MDKDRLWILIARKLSGEITAGEMKELDDLFATFPDQRHQASLLERLWDVMQLKIQLDDKTDKRKKGIIKKN